MSEDLPSGYGALYVLVVGTISFVAPFAFLLIALGSRGVMIPPMWGLFILSCIGAFYFWRTISRAIFSPEPAEVQDEEEQVQEVV